MLQWHCPVCRNSDKFVVLLVLDWHFLMCSTAIGFYSTGVTVTLFGVLLSDILLSTGVTVTLSCVQYSDRLLFYWC